ncbi:hypothetical protein C5B89_06600 [Haloferax sp. Atlit-47N]|uniref:hypothetical protein n=1 Tax=Haloferax sp. Atlit-47N TaxID=2077199 RepID=UPI000E267DD8|nr:hypothetical protein [Haloferax sp. Atlit-47N]RDZ41606.1 hypothetical protein C5B89_06600 [Haloferax sp. Atlit-47N]
MPGTLSYNEDLAELDGDVRPIRGSDLDQETLKAGAEVTVYREKVPQDKDLWFGAGGKDRASADSSPMHADIVASGNGSGTAGDTIGGTLYAAITDSDGRALYTRKLGDLELLSEFASESPTERPLMYSLAPYAMPGRFVEFRIDADANSDGKEIDPAASNVMLYRSAL